MKSKLTSITLGLAACVAMLITVPADLCAATLTVTSAADSGPGSLRSALKNSRSGDTIKFSLSALATITLTSGELLVSKNLQILGPGAGNLAVSGNKGSRVFHVASRTTVTISGLTITQGFTAGSGAGIYSDHATLTVSNCIVSGNSTANGGSVSGIYSDGSLRGDATLTVANCIVSENSGGGICNNGNGNASGTVTATVRDSLVSGNSTINSSGGGICNIGAAKLNVMNSTLTGNSAQVGGGLFNSGGLTEVTVINCTLDDNSATSAGGGIFSASGTLTVLNSTLSGNSVTGNGGGIFNYNSGTLTVLNSTLSGNSASMYGGSIYNLASLQIGSTILSVGASGGGILGNGTVTSFGYNLSSDSGSGVLTHPADQINTNPLLGPLQDNGGPTWTHAPLPGSPAIDAGKKFSGLATDQRGAARTADFSGLPNATEGDGTDIGAVEVQ